MKSETGTILRRSLAMVLIFAMTIICFAPLSEKNVYGASYGSSVRNVMWGVNGLSNPKQGSSTASGTQQNMTITANPWAGDSVFIGKYNGTLMKWRVLDTTGSNGNSSVGGGILLQSNKSLVDMKYSSTAKSDQWNTSDVRKWIQDNYPSWFSGKEGEALISTTTSKGTASVNWLQAEGLKGDKVFILDAGDAANSNYGYFSNSNANKWYTEAIGNASITKLDSIDKTVWWLRSPAKVVYSDGKVDKDPHSGVVDADGKLSWSYIDYGAYGVVPAMNISANKVIMTSTISTDKTLSFRKTTSITSGNNSWYLTLQDGTGLSAGLTSDSQIKAGESVTVNITSLPSNNANKYSQISAMLVKDDIAVAYGSISKDVKTGEITVDIPQGLASGSYTLRIFAEAVNKAETSYASNAADISIEIAGTADDGGSGENPDGSTEITDNTSLINGVKATTLKLKVTASKSYMNVAWTKSKGYTISKYQVWRSTKKNSGYKKIYTTTKKSYKNKSGLKKGKKYYYKVRGSRVIDGKTYYTKWSNIVSRKAK